MKLWLKVILDSFIVLILCQVALGIYQYNYISKGGYISIETSYFSLMYFVNNLIFYLSVYCLTYLFFILILKKRLPFELCLFLVFLVSGLIAFSIKSKTILNTKWIIFTLYHLIKFCSTFTFVKEKEFKKFE
jgi:hypothetical protein